MIPNSSDVPSTERTRSRWFTAVAILLATVVISLGSTAAVAASAAERTAHQADVRSAAIADFGHRIGVGAGDLDVSASRLASARDLATDELTRAAAALAASTGKAADATVQTLRTASDTVTAQVATGTAADVLGAVYTLREAEKSATTEAAAWQVAEDARVAAEAAAAAQAAAAASAANSVSYSDDSDDWSGSSSSSSTSSSSAAAPASGPVAEDCGPCPGATLVPVVWEGVTYWGCP